jgi:hypothetical protein
MPKVIKIGGEKKINWFRVAGCWLLVLPLLQVAGNPEILRRALIHQKKCIYSSKKDNVYSYNLNRALSLNIDTKLGLP